MSGNLEFDDALAMGEVEGWVRKGTENRDYQLLLDRYRSGQVSERQWREHLKDRDFAAWLKAQLEAGL